MENENTEIRTAAAPYPETTVHERRSEADAELIRLANERLAAEIRRIYAGCDFTTSCECDGDRCGGQGFAQWERYRDAYAAHQERDSVVTAVTSGCPLDVRRCDCENCVVIRQELALHGAPLGSAVYIGPMRAPGELKEEWGLTPPKKWALGSYAITGGVQRRRVRGTGWPVDEILPAT